MNLLDSVCGAALLLLVGAPFAGGCSKSSADGCSKDSDCRSSRVCERSRCVEDDEDEKPRPSTADAREREVLKAENEALQAKLKELQLAVDARLRPDPTSGDDASRQKLELELALCKAELQERNREPSLPHPPHRPPPSGACNCAPSDPLCACQ